MNETLEVDLFVDEEKGVKYVLSISEFRDKMYLSIRKWYMSYDEGYKPTKEGVNVPYNIHSTQALYVALRSILSDTEVLDEVIDHINQESLKNLLKKSELYNKVSEVIGIPDNPKITVDYITPTKVTIEVSNND